MPKRLSSKLILIALLCASGGCAVYDKYGYGKVARSPIPQEYVTAVSLPANAPSISQRFRPDNLSRDGGHKGFDILVPHRTPVLAAADGEISRVELSFLYGKQVMIDHAEGAAGFRLQTRYFHLTEQLVAVGEPVRRGQLIAYSGATGLTGLFPHLHFEVYRLNDAQPPIGIKYLDPQHHWIDGAGLITCFDRGRKYAAKPVRLTYPVPCRDLEWQ